MTSTREDDGPEPSTNWRKILSTGLVVQFSALFCIGGWAAFARLDGGAVAPGVVAVESHKKTIQHLEGGIVKEILVSNGQLVQAGDLLVGLDPTRAQAAVETHSQQLAAALAQEARLVAERDQAADIELSPEVITMRSNPKVDRAVVDQERAFRSRRKILTQQTSIIEAQIGQLHKEIEALKIEEKTSYAQLVFVSKELEGLRGLLAKQLVQLTRVTAMERDELTLKGSIARVAVDIAKAEQKIIESQLRKSQLEQDYQQEANKQIPELRKTINDLRQQILVAEDTIRRVDIRAPISGTVQELKLFTIGGVARAGEPLMAIVPNDDRLIVRAQFSPLDAERVRAGMRAEIKFTSFKASIMEATAGTVRTISSDRQVDPENPTKDPYFASDIEIDRSTVPAAIADKLTAGLPADVVIPTGERTVWSYLIAPISERLFKAMREE